MILMNVTASESETTKEVAMTLPVIPPFISGFAQLGEPNPPGGVWLQAYPIFLHRRWGLGERDHLMFRRSATTGPQRSGVVGPQS
jgi:hypothetical protein